MRNLNRRFPQHRIEPGPVALAVIFAVRVTLKAQPPRLVQRDVHLQFLSRPLGLRRPRKLAVLGYYAQVSAITSDQTGQRGEHPLGLLAPLTQPQHDFPVCDH